jgi:hypothetical protein
MTDDASNPKPPKMLMVELPEQLGPLAFANHMVVTFDLTSAYLNFFQAAPPILIGTQEEQERRMEETKSVKAQVTARVAMPLSAFREVIRQIHEILTKQEGGGSK